MILISRSGGGGGAAMYIAPAPPDFDKTYEIEKGGKVSMIGVGEGSKTSSFFRTLKEPSFLDTSYVRNLYGQSIFLERE